MKTISQITKEDILKSWKNGNTIIDWRKLPTENEKKEWLRACLSVTGLPEHQITAVQWTIDGDQVTSNIDFYCLIGEVFFGYRGYLGQDLDGFHDCFSEIYIHNKTIPAVQPGASVVFKNSGWLRQIWEEEYFLKITQAFREHGFNVILQ